MDAVKSQHSARPPGYDLMAPPGPHADPSETQTSSKRVAEDARPRGASPKLPVASDKRDVTPLKSTTNRLMGRAIARTALVAGKSLLPVTERRSHEDKVDPRSKREAETEKWDIAPDGYSAGREGRQFAVANVGNNGRIYLRPSVRPVHQRYPQPNFTFPVTPPGAEGLDLLGKEKTRGSREAKGHKAPQPHASQWTPTPSTSPLAGDAQYFPDPQNPSRPTRHRRAMSDSTIHEVSAATELDKDAFKVVITKAGDDKRPRTMDDLNAFGAPLLNVNIPSWRIGTPRFTLRGTPVIRGSSYATTEDVRSSSASLWNQSFRSPNVPLPELATRKLKPLTVHPPPSLRSSAQRGVSGLPSPRLLRPLRSTYLSTQLVIEPAMFTELTFKPACDDRSIVRYSPAGAVTAATPPRLVAEITSPSFLDYELISDFFLTFRAFLEPADLLRMLVARLRWALARNDEVGMIVRVRTFVAMRHWILNYFVDDFVLEYDLRVTFCNLLNEFVDELSHDASGRKVQLKILAELKKCWRRVCAQYWDGPEFDDSLSPEVPIAPGGVAGNRDANLDPGFWEREGLQPPQLDVLAPLPKIAADFTSPHAEGPRAAPMGDFVILGNRPGTPENQVSDGADLENGTGSPLSQASMDIVSCSFPSKNMKALNPNPAHLMAAHPVSSNSVHTGSGPVATTPKALVGKRVRPSQAHKRNNSLSDSLREHGSDKSSSQDQEFSMTWHSAGSLVRGNLLPPGQAFVDYEHHGPYGCNNRQTTIFQPKHRSLTKEGAIGGAMSGYGMRKLLGSVRRALRSRGQGLSPTHGHFMSVSPAGPRGATTNRLPGTAIVPQAPPRQNGGRPRVRIDLLGAEVAEDFKKAVREEEAAAEAERLAVTGPPNSAPPFGVRPEYSGAHMGLSTFDDLPLSQKQRPFSDMAITTGSKSIVIVDDTVPFEIATANGPYPPVGNPSVDTFADTFMPSCTDLTPPNTPPADSIKGDTPRRSSYLLNQHVIRPPLEDDTLPPFIPDLTTLGGSQSVRVSEDFSKLSTSTGRRLMQPPASGGTFRMHRRGRSTGTHQSLNSMMHRRYNSCGSSILQPPSIQGLDAPTDPENLAMDNSFDIPVPAPLRVLRRRPGGDLRAARNVGDLDRTSLRRSQSVGSLATYTESIRSSYLLHRPHSAGHSESVFGHVPDGRGEAFSLGQLAEKPAKREVSLFSTHSSKPVMRPSFEQEAQKLAQIPDDEDAGGIESALLKLEGKYDKRPLEQSVGIQNPTAMNESKALDPEEGDLNIGDGETQRREKKENRHAHIIDDPVAADERGVSDMGRRPTAHIESFLSEGSHESYCSIPLLDREFADDGRNKTWIDRSFLRGSGGTESPAETEKELEFIEQAEVQHLSFDVIQKTDSIERIKPGATAPSEAEDQSFLEDDSADDTDLSSELSNEGIYPDTVEGDEALFSKYRSPDPPHGLPGPLTMTRNSSHQMTLAQALAMSPESCRSRNDPAARSRDGKRLPPTPEMTPVVPQSHGPTSPCELAGPSHPMRGAPKPETVHFSKYSVHLPFILAFDSDILAQQFTLIEKDALNEIDWKELIDMNWKNAARSDSRSWVDFLRNSDAQGVEVVIARFNIMVKWAISEIVLTQHIEERARCIIKLIHIASHCRQYRNFATLAQLTIALSSNEVSRLSNTWELVPAHDVNTLHSLEMLVTPSRNFHAIRAEMEMGSDAGCIPFVGIYTHDLLYNVQRPSEIASSPTTTPLVNFERCRIGAAVVKTLLRLLEASTRYFFLPIEGITERCLWIGALSDEEIRRHSDSLE